MNAFGGLPPSLAMASLDRPGNRGRRAAIGKLVALMTLAPAAWLAWGRVADRGWIADQRTTTGERRELRLADGTTIMLNSASAIKVRYDDTHRLIQLRAGEIMVETARDTRLVKRPFVVDSAQGRLVALGTRFAVRQFEGRTAVSVLQSAVPIEPRKIGVEGQLVLRQGRQAAFTSAAIEPEQALDPAAMAWTQGMLLAVNMPLAEFAAELARYRTGFIRVEPDIANLRVSGTFPVDDTNRTLSMLMSTYRIAIYERFDGYWVTLTSR
ncbi:FecR domain-containing protein [Paraburkholderia tropica]|uniref:FecR domain-containing protein n=1 Tax=Paraburkholderia tropica TaxID=92647 RepID=UPI002AB28DF2|nr:FecR domain-containing protein [Paraburkholderia tropica]